MKFKFTPALPLVFTLAATVIFCLSATTSRWGFFGHRRINRMAVFTLPPEMGAFYKKHLEFITEHAVDPDKRRYATKHEAVRHYIDIDHWDTYPFEQVPRNWVDALMQHTRLQVVNSRGDTLAFGLDTLAPDLEFLLFRDTIRSRSYGVNARHYRNFFIEQILPQYYEDEWKVDCELLEELFGKPIDCQQAFASEHFSEYGILPYHLNKMQADLTTAFRQKNVQRILRLSAEMGHYIGDAHVPLHTTENYNGQLTGQVGIHAFWESRLPELFADKRYDFFVGPATYWERPDEVFWKTVLASHVLVDSVLQIEKRLSLQFPQDQQYCYEDRLDQTIRTQCEAYAEAYDKAMGSMVEDRMRAAILAVGSSWFTAWVNAGQPDLRRLELDIPVVVDLPPPDPQIKGRVHE
ncbi:MAG: zinc dependent phospholipase C family protein [Saprospiraceae bacterium]|nr:hypothetical protein [Lewinella sp.]